MEHGKTTTIKMILGLLSIDEGEIKVNGFDVKKEFEKAMECSSGIVENPDMYGYMSGIDNLKLYARLRNVKRTRIDEIIELVGMKEAANTKVSKYSLRNETKNGIGTYIASFTKIINIR